VGLINDALAFSGAAGSPFELSFVDAYGADRRERLAECRDVQGRPPRWCSTRCRQTAYRERKRQQPGQGQLQ
jgi:hypothetical protein